MVRADSALLIHRMLNAPPVHCLQINVNQSWKSQKIAVESAKIRRSTGGDNRLFVGHARAAEGKRSAVGSQYATAG
jgi:hypothetical protein